MIKEINGDIVELAKKDEFDILIHFTNCFHVMANLVSGRVAKSFPQAYRADMQTTMGWIYKLGTYSYYLDKKRRLKIVNLYSQFDIDSCHEYTAIGLGLRDLAQVLKGDEIIGISGEITGLDKDKIKLIIDKELDDFNVKLVYLPIEQIERVELIKNTEVLLTKIPTFNFKELF